MENFNIVYTWNCTVSTVSMGRFDAKILHFASQQFKHQSSRVRILILMAGIIIADTMGP